MVLLTYGTFVFRMRWSRAGRRSQKVCNRSTYTPTQMFSSRKLQCTRVARMTYDLPSSSSPARSWRSLSISMHTFTGVQKRPRPSELNGSHPETAVPILLSSLPSGLTAPSRPQANQSNLHFPHSCLIFHPTQMMFGLGTADGMIRLQGCQFNSGKDHYVPEADARVGLSGLTHSNGRVNGAYTDADAQIDFPSMR